MERQREDVNFDLFATEPLSASAYPTVGITLLPTIMEVEHYPIVKESHLGGTHFPSWEEEYAS